MATWIKARGGRALLFLKGSSIKFLMENPKGLTAEGWVAQSSTQALIVLFFAVLACAQCFQNKESRGRCHSTREWDRWKLSLKNQKILTQGLLNTTSYYNTNESNLIKFESFWCIWFVESWPLALWVEGEGKAGTVWSNWPFATVQAPTLPFLLPEISTGKSAGHKSSTVCLLGRGDCYVSDNMDSFRHISWKNCMIDMVLANNMENIDKVRSRARAGFPKLNFHAEMALYSKQDVQVFLWVWVTHHFLPPPEL